LAAGSPGRRHEEDLRALGGERFHVLDVLCEQVLAGGCVGAQQLGEVQQVGGPHADALAGQGRHVIDGLGADIDVAEAVLLRPFAGARQVLEPRRPALPKPHLILARSRLSCRGHVRSP
jgi:hypothetical protein